MYGVQTRAIINSTFKKLCAIGSSLHFFTFEIRILFADAIVCFQVVLYVREIPPYELLLVVVYSCAILPWPLTTAQISAESIFCWPIFFPNPRIKYEDATCVARVSTAGDNSGMLRVGGRKTQVNCEE